MGTLRPLHPKELPAGTDGVAEIRLREPVIVSRGDRFIVRRPSPATTIGGGTVLDPQWRRPRSGRLLAALEGLSGSTEDAVLQWFEGAGRRGLTVEELRPRLPFRAHEMEDLMAALTTSGRVLEITANAGDTGRWISGTIFEQVADGASRVLGRFFDRNRLIGTMPKAELAGRVIPGLPGRITDWYLAALERRGILRIDGDGVRLPGFEVRLSETESRAAEEVLQAMESSGLTPPDGNALADQISPAAAPGCGAAVDYLLGLGKLVCLPNGVMISAAAIEALRQALLDSGSDRFTVQEFKNRFGLTRKWAIPLLEHLDSIGFTRRAGDVRLIARRGP